MVPGDRPARRRGGGVAWQGLAGALRRTPGGVLFPGRWGVLFPAGSGAAYRRHGVWCRLLPARFRGGGGVAGPCRGLAKDAWGRPSSGLPVGRPVWCLLWQARCWPGTVSRVPGGAWERCLSIRDEASAETPEKRYLANEETVRNGSGEWGRENEAWQCLKSGQHGNAEISGNGASGNGASGNGASGNGASGNGAN